MREEVDNEDEEEEEGEVGRSGLHLSHTLRQSQMPGRSFGDLLNDEDEGEVMDRTMGGGGINYRPVGLFGPAASTSNNAVQEPMIGQPRR